MNLVILFKEDFKDNSSRVTISGRRARHIISVHRAEKGRTLNAGLLNGMTGSAVVEDIAAEKVVMDVKFEKPPPEAPPLTLIFALPRPKSFRKLIQAGSSLGIKKFIAVESWRVDKSYWNSPVIKEDAVFEEMILGLEQAKDTVMPEISFKRRFKPFVEDELPAICKGSRCLLADAYTSDECPALIKDKTVLAIGPEGGFTDYEINAFKNNGFKAVSLGARILRVEYAAAALAGRLFQI